MTLEKLLKSLNPAVDLAAHDVASPNDEETLAPGETNADEASASVYSSSSERAYPALSSHDRQMELEQLLKLQGQPDQAACLNREQYAYVCLVPSYLLVSS